MKLKIYPVMRLSYFLPLLFVLFYFVVNDMSAEIFSPTAYFITSLGLAWYAFFVFPLLANSRRKIDQLTLAVRKESSDLFRVVAKSAELPEASREEFKLKLNRYVMTKAGDYTPDSAQSEYQELINFALSLKGKEAGQAVIDMLYQNEDNRSAVSMNLRSHVYAHEWILSFTFLVISIIGLLVLSATRVGYEQLGLEIIAAGACYPLIMLKKFNDSTHKHAQEVWGPFSRLIETGYKEIG